jgi:hypothetical protein
MPYRTRWLTNLLSAPPVLWPNLDFTDASRAFTAGVASWTTVTAEFSLLQAGVLKALAAPWAALPPEAAKAVEPAKETRFVAEGGTGDLEAEELAARYTDDIDGSAASECVEFALDGREYEITLSGENAARLRAVLARYVAAAQATGRKHRQLAHGAAVRSGSTGRSRNEKPVLDVMAT